MALAGTEESQRKPDLGPPPPVFAVGLPVLAGFVRIEQHLSSHELECDTSREILNDVQCISARQVCASCVTATVNRTIAAWFGYYHLVKLEQWPFRFFPFYMALSLTDALILNALLSFFVPG